MSDLDKLKNFVVKISRSLNVIELSMFGIQIFSFCDEKDIPIPGLHKESSFLEFMDFAFKQSLITTTNTYLISQLLIETERYDLNEELFYLEKTFTKIEKRLRSFTDSDILSDKSYYIPTPVYTTTKRQQYGKTSTKSEVMKLFSKSKKLASNKVSRRRVSDSQDLRESNNILLTDIEVITYCTQITPEEWKQLAIIGFKLTISQVERIDYDNRTMQDKALAIFSVWKNLSLGSQHYPPYTKQGLKQALVKAKLNGLIYRLYLN